MPLSTALDTKTELILPTRPSCFLRDLTSLFCRQSFCSRLLFFGDLYLKRIGFELLPCRQIDDKLLLIDSCLSVVKYSDTVPPHPLVKMRVPKFKL